ncbi:hypothetical protein NL676_015285 [Syzygium grande]|nr:hypothetical protein NL676_015285 [Syzygium grande]
MEDVAYTPNSTSENLLDSAMDLDLMDQLLFEGCWLETDALNSLPLTESDQANYYPFQSIFQEEARKDFAKSPPSTCPRIEERLEMEQKNIDPFLKLQHLQVNLKVFGLKAPKLGDGGGLPQRQARVTLPP